MRRRLDRSGRIDSIASCEMTKPPRSLSRSSGRLATNGGPSTFAWVENAAPTGRRPKLQFGQLWTHRELIYFFALRDVKVRYKQAFLGAAWAGLQPLIGALAFTLLFNRLADVTIEGDSYFALRPRRLRRLDVLLSALGSGTNSLLYNAELLTKVSLPRIVLPFAALLPPLVDLVVGVLLAIVIAIVWGGGLSLVGLVVGLPIGVLLLVVATARSRADLQRVDREVPRRCPSSSASACSCSCSSPRWASRRSSCRSRGARSSTSTRSPAASRCCVGVLPGRRHRELGLVAISVVTAARRARRRRVPLPANERQFVDII